jgi:FkbM family methyltransferase
MTWLPRHYLYRAVDIVLSPRLALWRRSGVILGLYQDLNRPWLTRLGIKTVLDIGANVGRFAITARKLFPQAHIYSFEPLPDCLAKAAELMRGDAGFTPVSVALGIEPGAATFYRSSSSPSSSFLRMTAAHTGAYPGTGKTREVRVPVDSLDRVAAAFDFAEPMLVKIDVQGFEEQVLQGGEVTIRRASVLLIETSFEMLYEGQALFEAVHSLLQQWGFEFKGNLDQAHAPADGRLLQADSLFVRRGLLDRARVGQS